MTRREFRKQERQRRRWSKTFFFSKPGEPYFEYRQQRGRIDRTLFFENLQEKINRHKCIIDDKTEELIAIVAKRLSKYRWIVTEINFESLPEKYRFMEEC